MEDKDMQGGCGSGCGNGKGGCACGGGGGGMMRGGGMWRMHRKPFMGLLALAAVVYLILLSRNAWKSYAYIGRPTTQRDTISIDAEGKVTALPDIAKISIGVETQKKTVSEAQTENSTKMNAIIAKLKDLGVAKEDIQTTNYSIYPTYDYSNGKQTETGFQITQNVDIKVRKLDSISDILAAVAQLGANQVGGVNFTIDDPESLRQQARLKGIEMAKSKAQALAEAAGVKLGKVVGFSESSSTPQPPIFYAKDMAAGMGSAPSAAPAVEPGSQDVIVDVTVIYEIL
jgi:uncharacterized protein YggE